VKSFLTTVVSALAASALLLLPAVVDGKARVKKTVTLETGHDLVLSVEGDLSQCKQWICLVNLTPAGSRGVDLVRVLVLPDGSWEAYVVEDEDKDKDDKEDSDSGDDDDDSAGDDDDSADWQAKPLLTLEERGKKNVEKALGKYKVETAKGFVWGSEYDGVILSVGGDPAAAAAEDSELAEQQDRLKKKMKKNKSSAAQITIPAAVLPEGNFNVWTNGYFGLLYEGVKIGSPKRTGVIRVKR